MSGGLRPHRWVRFKESHLCGHSWCALFNRICCPNNPGARTPASLPGFYTQQTLTSYAWVQVGIIERAIEAGSSVLIENMGESIDAVLNPVITRSTFKKGRSLYVKLGDKEVEYNPKFRLIMHTKLSNPHYPPEIQAETTLINFTVTEGGLEDQLLALVVNKERPDLENTKIKLVNQNTEFTIRLKQLEDDLLSRLSTAEGDLTEDIELIESLEESKRVADDINIKARTLPHAACVHSLTDYVRMPTDLPGIHAGHCWQTEK